MIKTTIITLFILTTFQNQAFSKDSKVKSKAQVLKFDGMSINNSKGNPRDAFSSSKEKTDFDYFFKTKVSFKAKVVESLEAIR
jgi:hypothetical protein